MANHTTSSLSANLYLYYVKTLLDTLGRIKVIENLSAKSVTIPKGFGVQAKWLRYDEFNVTTPSTYQLVEGVVPSEATLATRNITATVQQYGTYVAMSDKLVYSAIDPILESAAERLGEHSGQLIEILCRNELEASLPNQFANGKANLAATGSSDVMTAKEILKGVITLQKASVPKHESGSYVAVVSPASKGDLQNDTAVGSWVDINKYVGDGREMIMNGEAGKVYGCKILMSDLISSTTTGTLGSATVYANLLLGKGAFGTVKLGKENVAFYTKDPSSGGTADPIEQISTVGYKVLGFVAKYLGGSSNGTSDRGVQIRAGSAF